MDERKEKWLHGLEYGSIENHDHQMVAEAAKLIRAYEAEREARKAIDKVRHQWREDDLFLSKEAKDWAVADAALANTWKEALNAE